MSRIRMRRVAHAVLWGDGLGFRVRDGRLISSRAQHTLNRKLSGLMPRLHGHAVLFGSLAWGDTARQQIRTSRWRVTLR